MVRAAGKGASSSCRQLTETSVAVRDWIRNQLLDAYKFQGHEWRVTPENHEKFRREQRESLKLEVVGPEPNLGEWRKAVCE